MVVLKLVEWHWMFPVQLLPRYAFGKLLLDIAVHVPVIPSWSRIHIEAVNYATLEFQLLYSHVCMSLEISH